MLPGLDDPSIEEADGIVINYRYFGVGGNANPNSLGRTATHEIGHYFGLRHIWGDGGCSADDYVDDTPLVGNSHGTCPNTKDQYKACDGSLAMFQNYMDYTEDKCMSLFTLGQSERMHVVLASSPRRKDLPNSAGKNEPTRVANDGGIRSINIAGSDICTGSFSPVLEFRNYGSNIINTVKFQVMLDGAEIATHSFEPALTYPDVIKLTLPEIKISTTGYHEFIVKILEVNGQTDGRSSNNIFTYTINIPADAELPYLNPVSNNQSDDFLIQNPDRQFGWEITPTTDGNQAFYINIYDYSNNGSQDYLISPIFDLSDTQIAFANFDVAYTPFNNSQDKLNVYVSTDCSAELESATLLYSKQGQGLATAPFTADPFVPTSSQWRTEFIDLSQFIGYPQVQLIFEVVNNFGNNLYLDNIRLTNSYDDVSDVILRSIVSPSPIQMDTSGVVQLEVFNASDEVVNSLQITVRRDGSVIENFTRTNLSIAPRSTQILTVSSYKGLALNQTYEWEAEISHPNDKADLLSYNNQQVVHSAINKSQDIIPLRKSFSGDQLNSVSSWASITSNSMVSSWRPAQVVYPTSNPDNTGNNHAVEAYFANQQLGPSAWLVSPTLNISNSEQAGMEFYYSLSGAENQSSDVLILASTNGGKTYPDTIWSTLGFDSNARQNMVGRPIVSTDWNKQFVSLRNYVGEDSLRIAFVGKGNYRSSVYIDEVQVYPLNDEPTYYLPSPGSMSLYPNPVNTNQTPEVSVVFNFNQRQDLVVQIIDSQGKLMWADKWFNALQVPFSLNVANLSSGLYFVRVQGKNFTQTRRLVINR